MSQSATPIPPFLDTPITDQGRFSKSWNQYNVDVSDALANLTSQLASLSGTVGAIGQGVTDGSNAAAGHIGEYLSASGSLGLTNAATNDVVTLTLPAGDWDVTGSVTISPTAINVTYAQAWLSPAANTPADPGRAIIQAAALGISGFVVGPVRFSLAASAVAYLGCQANFPSGTVTASGTIRARRIR